MSRGQTVADVCPRVPLEANVAVNVAVRSRVRSACVASAVRAVRSRTSIPDRAGHGSDVATSGRPRGPRGQGCMHAVMEAHGSNGQVRFDGQFVTITRRGFLARATVGKGDKRIPLGSITAVQWKPATRLVKGFIHFTVPGGNERRSHFGRQTQDANGRAWSVRASRLAILGCVLPSPHLRRRPSAVRPHLRNLSPVTHPRAGAGSRTCQLRRR